MTNIIKDVFETFNYISYVLKSKYNNINNNHNSNIEKEKEIKENKYKDFIIKFGNILNQNKDFRNDNTSRLGLKEQIEKDERERKEFIEFVQSKRFFEIIFLLGGASFISFYLRTLYFGKTIRAIEIPDGNLMTMVVRSNNLIKLKKQILLNQPPIYPGVDLTIDDIKASAFIEPHFTEPILSNKDIKTLIQDGSYLVWTKGDFEIPRTAVALKSLIKDKDLFMKFSSDAELDKYIKQISLFGPPLKPSLNKKFSSMHIIKNVDPQSLFQQWRKISKLIFSKESLNKDSSTTTTTTTSTLDNQNEEDPSTIQLTGKERDSLIDLIIIKSPKQDEIIHIFRKYKNNLYQLKYQLKLFINNHLQSIKSK